MEMEASRATSTILLIIGIVIGAILLANHMINVLPQYSYLAEAEEWLETAQKEPELPRKLEHVEKAFSIYQTGLSQENTAIFTVMLSCNSIEEVDYLLTKAIPDLGTEKERGTQPLRSIATFILVSGFLATTFVGTFYDYEKWDQGEQHMYNIIVVALLTGIIVALI